MKILILRFSSIGDIVLTTPVVRCLKKQLGATVHFLTKSSFAPILTANPYIDRVYSFEQEISEVVEDLRAEQYDWVIDLHHNLRSLRLKMALGRPAKAFDKLNFEKWLLVNLHIDRLPDLHIVQRYLYAAAHLGVRYDGHGLDYFIPPDQEVEPPSLAPWLIPEQYVALVLGATHATKRLPLEKMQALCQQIQSPLILLGGPAEAETAAILEKTAGRQIFNACGQLSLHQSASIVRQAAQVLTHDTGLMHIAAAFLRPIVSVWGNTVPKFGMYPLYPDGVDLNQTIEVRGLSCRPCSKIGYAECPKGHFRCMRDISVAEIVAALS